MNYEVLMTVDELEPSKSSSEEVALSKELRTDRL